MDIKVTIPAGGMKEIIGGDFIYCREATHDLFDIQPEGGERIEFHTGAQERFATPVRQFRVYNVGVAALTATFRVKDGGEYRDNRFVLTGGVDVNNLPATFPDGLTEIVRRGYGKQGASKVYGAFSGAGVVTVLATATNTGGVIIRNWEIAANTSNWINVFVDGVAPTSYTDYTKKLFASLMTAGVNRGRDVFVAAGLGVYVASQAASNTYTFDFDLL